MINKISDVKFNNKRSLGISSQQRIPFLIHGERLGICIEEGTCKQIFQHKSCMSMLAYSVYYINKYRYGILEKISENIEYYEHNEHTKSEKISFSAVRKSHSINHYKCNMDPISEHRFISDRND